MGQYTGRIVTFIVTPIVAGLAAWVVPWVAENFPGAPNLDADQLSEIAVAAVVAVAGVAFKWLDNLGKHERAQLVGSAGDPVVPPGLQGNE